MNNMLDKKQLIKRLKTNRGMSLESTDFIDYALEVLNNNIENNNYQNQLKKLRNELSDLQKCKMTEEKRCINVRRIRAKIWAFVFLDKNKGVRYGRF